MPLVTLRPHPLSSSRPPSSPFLPSILPPILSNTLHCATTIPLLSAFRVSSLPLQSYHPFRVTSVQDAILRATQVTLVVLFWLFYYIFPFLVFPSPRLSSFPLFPSPRVLAIVSPPSRALPSFDSFHLSCSCSPTCAPHCPMNYVKLDVLGWSPLGLACPTW